MNAPIQTESNPAIAGVKHSMLTQIAMILPFAWLWFHLIDNLRLQWTTDPQYSYGLVVPLLTAGLLMRRWNRYSGNTAQSNDSTSSVLVIALIIFAIVLYFPTRLLEEAVPEWRPIGWLLAIQTIALTL